MIISPRLFWFHIISSDEWHLKAYSVAAEFFGIISTRSIFALFVDFNLCNRSTKSNDIHTKGLSLTQHSGHQRESTIRPKGENTQGSISFYNKEQTSLDALSPEGRRPSLTGLSSNHHVLTLVSPHVIPRHSQHNIQSKKPNVNNRYGLTQCLKGAAVERKIIHINIGCDVGLLLKGVFNEASLILSNLSCSWFPGNANLFEEKEAKTVVMSL